MALTIPGLEPFSSIVLLLWFDAGCYNHSADSSSTLSWIVSCQHGLVYLSFVQPGHPFNQNFIPSMRYDPHKQLTALSNGFTCSTHMFKYFPVSNNFRHLHAHVHKHKCEKWVNVCISMYKVEVSAWESTCVTPPNKQCVQSTTPILHSTFYCQLQTQ